MPSPFPGMDPWLEHPGIFPDFHDSFIIYMREALQPQLPPPYYAEAGDRIWVEVSHRQIGPDISIRRTEDEFPRESNGGGENGGGVAVVAQVEPIVVTVPHDEFREPFLEIYYGEHERLVTSIEVLSPSNKAEGSKGRELYLRKQRELLESQTHLVEIDLLRGGQHTAAVPLEWALPKTGSFDYHVCIHRFNTLEDYLVYPIRLVNLLPTITIPLLPGDPDVSLDLQAVFQRTYDTGPYQRRIRYLESEPVPPLDPKQHDWAKQRLTAKR